MLRFFKVVCFSIFFITMVTTITLYVQLNTIIKTAVESYGPKITRTSVKLSSVSLQPFSGKGRLRGLVIGNPKGFKSESAFSLKDIRMVIEPKSLTAKKIIIHKILIDSPEITYEMTHSGNNLQAIQKNVDSFIPPSHSSQNAAPSATKSFEIDLFILKGAKVHVLSYLMGDVDHVLELPEIRLENIGRGAQGATTKDVVSTVFKSITQNVIKAVAANSGQLLKGAADSFKSSKRAVSQLKNIFGR